MDVVTETDLALVDALQVNPRASWATIGAAIGISALTASRRWRALSSTGVAWTSSTMGPALFRGAFLELTCPPGRVDDVAARLFAMPDVLTVGRLVGEHHLYAIAVAPTTAALTRLLTDRIDQLEVVRQRAHAYAHVYGGPEWRLTVLNREQAAQVRAGRVRPLPRSTTDAADRSLFRALAADARRSHADLARELGTEPYAVRRQLERMRRRGDLTFRADIARPMAGWPVAALLRLDVPDDEVHEVGRELGGWPETRFCASLIGPANMVLVLNLRAPEQLEHLLKDLRTRHRNVGVVERSLVVRLLKVHGRLLDEQGRSTGLVPVDPWYADSAGNRLT